jgi:hypothetical protein
VPCCGRAPSTWVTRCRAEASGPGRSKSSLASTPRSHSLAGSLVWRTACVLLPRRLPCVPVPQSSVPDRPLTRQHVVCMSRMKCMVSAYEACGRSPRSVCGRGRVRTLRPRSGLGRRVMPFLMHWDVQCAAASDMQNCGDLGPMPDRNWHKKALTRLPTSSLSSSEQCRALASLA